MNNHLAATVEKFFTDYFNYQGRNEAERLAEEAQLMDTINILAPVIPTTSIVKWMSNLAQYTTLAKIDDFVSDLKHRILTFVGRVFDGVVNSFDRDEWQALAIKWARNEVEKNINKVLREKYPYLDEISLTADTVDLLSEEVGDWLAEVLNTMLSRGLKKPVAPFSGLFPPENIVEELNVFLTDEINERTKLHLSGILNNPNLTTELRQQTHEYVAEQIAYRVALEKAKIIAKISEVEIPGASKAQRLSVVNQVVDAGLSVLTSKKTLGINFNATVYLQQQYKKILNKEHQRNYRKTHKQNFTGYTQK